MTTEQDTRVSARRYKPSEAARAASDYYNSLPFEERQKLAPLLDNYRQMGLAEAYEAIADEMRRIDKRIRGIQVSS